MTSHTPVGRSNRWGTGRLEASDVIFTEFVVTCALHTATIIGNVESNGHISLNAPNGHQSVFYNPLSNYVAP